MSLSLSFYSQERKKISNFTQMKIFMEVPFLHVKPPINLCVFIGLHASFSFLG